MSSKLRCNDEALQLKVYATFGKSKKEVDETVQSIHEWLKTQEHLPEVMDVPKIRNFLLLNKFNVESTKQKIDMYYTVRSVVPDYFNACNPKLPHLAKVMDEAILAPHPELYEGLYKVYFFKTFAKGKACPPITVKLLFAYFEIALTEELMIGDIMVIDVGNFILEDFSQLTPMMFKVCFEIYQKIYALRLRAMYWINAPMAINKVLAAIKPWIKPKIFERVTSHPDASILNEVFSEEFLPNDYGGKGPSLAELTEMTKAKYRQYQARFDALDTLRVIEELRKEKLDPKELPSFPGDFKNLGYD